jgi:hypothetical protein
MDGFNSRFGGGIQKMTFLQVVGEVFQNGSFVRLTPLRLQLGGGAGRSS